MATMSPISPARMPFVSLNGTRMRNLSNIKNRQNAASSALSTPTKRPYTPETFEDFDLENIDPSSLSTKKSKDLKGNAIPIKPTHFILKQTKAEPLMASYPITPRRLESIRPTSRRPTTPSTAPAGRSPKNKRLGVLSRRRVSSSPFTRVDPPFASNNGLPFSIDAALSATVSSYQPAPVHIPTLEESMPQSWMFEIHEDTPEEELGNLMEFSTQTLDISDDEGKRAARDDRGKENIPPLDHVVAAAEVSTASPVSRDDAMTDEVRTPLGDLNASEYYAKGCDANSYIIVPSDKIAEPVVAPPNVDLPSTIASTPPPTDTNEWKDILAHMADAKKVQPEPSPIAIWESESAKAEDFADDVTLLLEEIVTAAVGES